MCNDDNNNALTNQPSPLAIAIAISDLVDPDAILHQDLKLTKSHLETDGFGHSR